MRRVAFDPFLVAPWASKLRNKPSRVVLLLGPVLAALVLLPTLVEGRALGTFRPILDLRLALGADIANSPPDFPLSRDTPSMWLLATILCTCVLVHRQWRLMEDCIPLLMRNGTLESRPIRERTRLQRLMDRVFGCPEPTDDGLRCTVRHMNRYLEKAQAFAPVLVLVAAVLTFLLTVGERESLFAAAAPAGLHGARRASWLAAAYNSWWASPSHPLGLLAYFLAASLGIYVVLIQNVVGMASVYFVVTLPSVATLRADWLNRDGHYGWLPIARVFQTVYLSLTLHGAALAVLLIAVGPAHFPWLAALLAIWVVVVPLYTLCSHLVFRRVERVAKQQRLESIQDEMAAHGLSPQSDTATLIPYVLEIDRVHRARIRPLRSGSWELPAIFTALVLPISIAVIQIVIG